MQETIYEAPAKPRKRLYGVHRQLSFIGAAKHLDVSQEKIHRWIRNRDMPAHQIGRLWKCRVSEVDEWVRVGGQNEPTEPAVEQE